MKITLNSGIAWLRKLLADYAEIRVSVPSESCHLGTLSENRRGMELTTAFPPHNR